MFIYLSINPLPISISYLKRKLKTNHITRNRRVSRPPVDFEPRDSKSLLEFSMETIFELNKLFKSDVAVAPPPPPHKLRYTLFNTQLISSSLFLQFSFSCLVDSFFLFVSLLPSNKLHLYNKVSRICSKFLAPAQQTKLK